MNSTCLRIALTASLAGLASPALADDEPDIFGRTGVYDLTGHPEIRDVRLDPGFVNGGEPTTLPSLKGLKGAATVELHKNFVYVQDADGELTIPPRSGQDLGRYFNFAAQETYRILPDEFVFFILFTTFDANVGAFFYSPEANDTRGLGSEVYDSNGGSPREGIVFMNYYRAIDEQFSQIGLDPGSIAAQRRSVFNQEVGHRWGSFVTVGGGANGSGPDVLLGRDEGHWSYFAHTSGSPMEGNDWRDNGNGSFTTVTDVDNYLYSDLDLYLMGMLAPEDVAPWFVIVDPDVGGQRDLFGQPLNAASPPQFISRRFQGGAVTVNGTRLDMTIDNVVRRAGIRNPDVASAPKSFRTVIIFLGGRNSPASPAVLTEFEELVDNFAAGFDTATRGLGQLDYILKEEVVLTPIGGACTDPAECDPMDATICAAIPAETAAICTRPCDTADTCPTGWCCKTNPATGQNACAVGDICMEPEPPACACDATADVCDMGCECDTACPAAPAVCSCDLTFSCDMGPNGGDCLCDPECPEEDGGCGCSTTSNAAGSSVAFVVMLMTAFGVRRRRR